MNKRSNEYRITSKLIIMKKIFLSLFFIIALAQINYSQTLHHEKRKELKAKKIYKVEIDSCTNFPGNIIGPTGNDILKRIEPVLVIYPTGDDINKWMLAWSK